MPIPFENPLAASMWCSFGRDRRLLADAAHDLKEQGIRTLDTWSDPDLNRTLIAFSGEHSLVTHGALKLAELILPSIDLRRHSGSHPRTGAIDTVRFSPLNDEVTGVGALSTFSEMFSRIHQIPVFVDGPDSDAGSERRILELHEGGFGSLDGRILAPDCGPPIAHEQWGVTTVFVGPLHLQACLELSDPSSKAAHAVAEAIQEMRMQGDSLMLGVHAEGFARPTHGGSLLLLTFEMPDEAYPDQVLKVAEKEARLAGAAAGKARALGIWRLSDLARATRLTVDEDRQVWDDA